jgi:hypothetical protein
MQNLMILHYILHQFCILQNWWLLGVRGVMGMSHPASFNHHGQRFVACHCSRMCRLLCLACRFVVRSRADLIWGLFLFRSFTVIKLLTFFINYRSMLLDRAAPWLTDGLRWLRLVIADHILVPNVGDPPLVVSASLFVLVALFFSSSLMVFASVVLRQRRLSLNNRAKDNIEMAINTSSIGLDTGTSRECHGFSNPHGSQSWVVTGTGAGW